MSTSAVSISTRPVEVVVTVNIESKFCRLRVVPLSFSPSSVTRKISATEQKCSLQNILGPACIILLTATLKMRWGLLPRDFYRRAVYEKSKRGI